MKGYIYKIINRETKKFYLGSTNDIHRRKREHLCKLRGNYHGNKNLQKDYNEFGESYFDFVYIKKFENIDRKGLLKEEQKYLEQLSSETSYNVHFVLDLDGYDSQKKSCYLLDLNGNVISWFDSKTSASKWLGLPNPTYLTRSSKNPKARIRSKNDGNRYRCIDYEFYEENKEEIESW